MREGVLEPAQHAAAMVVIVVMTRTVRMPLSLATTAMVVVLLVPVGVRRAVVVLMHRRSPSLANKGVECRFQSFPLFIGQAVVGRPAQA
jgi:hypothetical protein